MKKLLLLLILFIFYLNLSSANTTTTTELPVKQCPKGNDIRQTYIYVNYGLIRNTTDGYKFPSCSGIGSCNSGKCNCSAYIPFQGRSDWKGDDCSIPNITVFSIVPCKADGGGQVFIYVNDFSYLTYYYDSLHSGGDSGILNTGAFNLSITIGAKDCHITSIGSARRKENQLEIICDISFLGGDRGGFGYQTLSIYKDGKNNGAIYRNDTIFKYKDNGCPNNCSAIYNRGHCDDLTGICKCNSNLEIDHNPSDCSVKCYTLGCVSHLDSVDKVSAVGGTIALNGFFESINANRYFHVFVDNEYSWVNEVWVNGDTKLQVEVPPRRKGIYNLSVVISRDKYNPTAGFSSLILNGTVEYVINTCQCTDKSHGSCSRLSSTCVCYTDYIGDDCTVNIYGNPTSSSTTATSSSNTSSSTTNSSSTSIDTDFYEADSSKLPLSFLITLLVFLSIITLFTYFKKN